MLNYYFNCKSRNTLVNKYSFQSLHISAIDLFITCSGLKTRCSGPNFWYNFGPGCNSAHLPAKISSIYGQKTYANYIRNKLQNWQITWPNMNDNLKMLLKSSRFSEKFLSWLISTGFKRCAGQHYGHLQIL